MTIFCTSGLPVPQKRTATLWTSARATTGPGTGWARRTSWSTCRTTPSTTSAGGRVAGPRRHRAALPAVLLTLEAPRPGQALAGVCCSLCFRRVDTPFLLWDETRLLDGPERLPQRFRAHLAKRLPHRPPSPPTSPTLHARFPPPPSGRCSCGRMTRACGTPWATATSRSSWACWTQPSAATGGRCRMTRRAWRCTSWWVGGGRGGGCKLRGYYVKQLRQEPAGGAEQG